MRLNHTNLLDNMGLENSKTKNACGTMFGVYHTKSPRYLRSQEIHFASIGCITVEAQNRYPRMQVQLPGRRGGTGCLLSMNKSDPAPKGTVEYQVWYWSALDHPRCLR